MPEQGGDFSLSYPQLQIEFKGEVSVSDPAAETIGYVFA